MDISNELTVSNEAINLDKLFEAPDESLLRLLAKLHRILTYTLRDNARTESMRWEDAKKGFEKLTARHVTEIHSTGNWKIASAAMSIGVIAIYVAFPTAKLLHKGVDAGTRGVDSALQMVDTWKNGNMKQLEAAAGLKNTEFQEKLNKQQDGIVDQFKQIVSELVQLLRSASSSN